MKRVFTLGILAAAVLAAVIVESVVSGPGGSVKVVSVRTVG